MTPVELAALTSELRRIERLLPRLRPSLPLSPIAQVAIAGTDLGVLVDAAAVVAQVYLDIDPEVARGDRNVERITRVACSPPERCWLGAHDTLMGFEPVFVRETPAELVDREALARIRHWSTVLSPHLARPRAIAAGGASGAELQVTFDRVLGTSLDRLPALSPPLALGILAGAMRGLDALHAVGMTHGGVRARRVRIGAGGGVVLCYGFDAAAIGFAEDRAILARAVLERASFDDPLLLEILDARGEGACAVAADRIIDKNPSLADLAPAALWHETASDDLAVMLQRVLSREDALAVIATAVGDSGL